MEKIKNFFKNNYHIILLVLLFVTVGYTVSHVNFYSSDDYVYKRIAVSDWNVIFSFIKWHIKNWNGRTLVHFAEMMFLRYKYGYIVWQAVEAFTVTAVCAAVAKAVSAGKADFRRACTFSIFLFASAVPIFWKWTVSWIPGSFNYIIPSAGVVLLMLLTQKRKNSLWIYPLSLICGATTEQAGIMTVGLFFILMAEHFMSRKKLNRKHLICFLLSVVGYSTVLLSPGTSRRSEVQGELSFGDIMVNMFTVLRRRWLDNLYLVVLIVCIAGFTAFWLIKFKNRNSFTKKVNVPTAVLLIGLTVMNLGLKAILLVCKVLNIAVEFPPMANRVLFVVYIVYLVVYFGTFCYSTVLIYRSRKDVLPFIAFVLGFGSQIMLALSESSLHRMSVPGYFMFMIYAVYSFVTVAKELEARMEIKRYIKAMCVTVCALACIVQGYVGAEVALKGVSPADYVNEPVSESEFDDFLRKMNEEFSAYYSGEQWHERYDIKDFTLLR